MIAQQPFGSFTVSTWAYGDRTVPDIIANIITVLSATITIAAVAVFVVGAFFFGTSAGSEDRKSKGKNMMTYSIWSVVIVLGARSIVRLVAYFLWS